MVVDLSLYQALRFSWSMLDPIPFRCLISIPRMLLVPTYQASYPSGGDLPLSMAASPDGDRICVLNGGRINGFSCYETGTNGWQHVPSWYRDLGLNLTTPPYG